MVGSGDYKAVIVSDYSDASLPVLLDVFHAAQTLRLNNVFCDEFSKSIVNNVLPDIVYLRSNAVSERILDRPRVGTVRFRCFYLTTVGVIGKAHRAELIIRYDLS